MSLVSGAEGTQMEAPLPQIPASLSPPSQGSASRSPSQPSSSRSSYPPITSGPPQAGYEKASIAVLPFRSLSADKEDEYMAMGIGSEIGSALSRVPAIRVASNLATYRYRDDAPDLMEIAHKLNIRYVLNGSLRRAGTRIRVAARTIRCIASTVLWARTYERHIWRTCSRCRRRLPSPSCGRPAAS